MWKSFVRGICVTCLLGFGGWVSDAQGAATATLRAIAKNGTLLPGGPTSNLPVAPGDTIVAEVVLSGWSTPPFDNLCAAGDRAGQQCHSNADCPGSTCSIAGSGLAQTFQAALLGAAGAISNGADPVSINRLVLPTGWVAPVVKDVCPCDNPSYPTCDPAYGCVGAGHTPASGANLSVACNEIDADLIGGSCNAACCFGSIRSDYIFYGFANFPSVDISSLNIRWGGTIDGFDAQQSRRCSVGSSNSGGFCNIAADCPGGTCDANFLSYAGTLSLKVGTQACGTYTFSFNTENSQTFVANAAANPIAAAPSTITPLILTVTGTPTCPDEKGPCCDELAVGGPECTEDVHASACTGTGKRWGPVTATCATMNPPCAAQTGACCVDATGVCTNGVTQANCTGRFGGPGSTCATLNPPCANTITGVSPVHCIIDARIPNVQGQPAQRRGFTSMILTFQNPPGTGEDAANDFQVTHIPAAPAPPNPPTITVASGPGANDKTLTFSVPVQPGRWTCVRHIASNSRRCIGFQPADSNSNGTALPSDILDIIDNINNVRVPPLQIHQCDIDRSGVCLPADIITEIDLLQGIGFTPAQNGRGLEACPSTTP